jgi:AP-1 complex subunit beta-1
LCANLEELDEPEAKASLIWIIGEYANKIDNADELLGIFVDTFTEEAYPVQLQTLTAVVKLFLYKPDTSQGVVQRVLNTATKDCDSPDVRDRAYIYWRLLSTDPGAAKVCSENMFIFSYSLTCRQSVVLAHRPPIELQQLTVSPALLTELISEVSSLASVYHKPAETFIGQGRVGAELIKKGEECVAFNHVSFKFLRCVQHRLSDDRLARQKALQTVAAGQHTENLLDFDDEPATDGQPTGLAATQILQETSPAANNLLMGTSTNPLDDLVSIFGGATMSPAQPTPSNSFGMMNPTMLAPSPAPAGSPAQNGNVASPNASQNPQEDLLGLF